METIRPSSLFYKIIVLVTAIFSIYIVIINIGVSVYLNSWLYALLIIPVFAVILFVSAKLDIMPAAFAIMVFIMAFLVKGTFAYFMNTKPVSDFGLFYNYAVDLVNGKIGLERYSYFKTWAYQTGPVIYYAGIMKLFGTGLLSLKLVNCFFMAGSNVLIYLISRKVSNDLTARFVALLYLFYPAPYFLTSVLTNQHFAAFMFLVAIYVLLNENIGLLFRSVTAGILIAVGNAVRPLGVVIIASIVVWTVLEIKNKRGKGKVIFSALLIAVYIVVGFGLSAAVRGTGVNTEGLKNNMPLWKFVVGLNQKSMGQFSYEDENKIFTIRNISERNDKALDTVKERLQIEPYRMLAFMGIKIGVMWAQPDTLMWSNYEERDGKLVAPEKIKKVEPVVTGIEKMYYVGIFILLAIGLVRMFGNPRFNSVALLLIIILLFYFGIHMLIEIQVRYRYFAMLIVFILASTGTEVLFKPLKTYK